MLTQAEFETKFVNTVQCGDCLELLKEFPAGSVDSVVTDPPYGLTNGDRDALGKVFADIVFPDLANFYAKHFCDGEFPFPLDSVSLLDFVNRAMRVEPRVAMPECPIDFQSCASVRKEEVKATGKSPIGVSDGELPDGVQANTLDIVPNFVFQFRPSLDASLTDSLRGCLRQLGLGRIALTVTIIPDSSFARFLGSLSPRGPSFLADVVRFQDSASGEPHTSPSVVAGPRTELTAVLSFDLSRGTAELLPAYGADARYPICEIVSPQLVRTGTGAGGLPPEFEPIDFSFVGSSAHRTCHFFFHKAIIPYLSL